MSIHEIISSKNDMNILDINHHINMYSIFTQNYFDNCNTKEEHCLYSLYDQDYACNYLINNEGGSLYYHGVHNDEIISVEISGDGNQNETFILNRDYTIKGMYVILDLTEDEINYNHGICSSTDMIRTYQYASEPFNFYRKMDIYVVTNDTDVSFCPLWHLHNN